MLGLNRRLNPELTGSQAQTLRENLLKRVVGQDEAVTQIVDTYQMHQTGMTAPGRPIGNFLFLGPTGTGKTRMVEAVAESLLGDARAMVKVDCAEFQHSHEIAKLIGSPPGYLGHRETHPMLSQETLNQYHTDTVKISCVLFDEIEKASDSLWNLLLGILDKASLTLGDNKRVDFSRTLIFMTSNLGAAEMGTLMRPTVGFATSEIERQRAAGLVDEDLDGRITRAGNEAARRKFTPEFINRIDKTVVFRSLGTSELRRILDIELGMLQQRISQSTLTFAFRATARAKDYLLAEGTDLNYGARHLRRTIERHLVRPMANLIASAQVFSGDLIEVDFDEDSESMVFVKQSSHTSMRDLLEMANAPDRNEGAASATYSTVRQSRRARA